MKKSCVLIVPFLVGFLNLSLAQNTITGQVFDEKTKEPLAGADIFIPGTTFGTITNGSGKFIFESPHPFDSIIVSNVGYQS